MITINDYWMGRDTKYHDDLTLEIMGNAHETVEKVNQLLSIYEAETGKVVDQVNSGWRPKTVNDTTANSASKSKHLTAQACDLYDPYGDLDKWCLKHLDVLVEIGLWMEHPGWTAGHGVNTGWCHLQIVPPMSTPRVRVYVPSISPPQTSIYGRSPIYVDV